MKRLKAWLDPILLIGLLVSVGIGALMVLTGNDTLSGLTIGLLSTVITLLIDVVARIQKTEEGLLGAFGLSRILSDPFLGESLDEIARNYGKVSALHSALFLERAQRSINECRTGLLELSLGAISLPYESAQEYGFVGFATAQRSVKVIHIGTMDYWSTPFGKKYYQANLAAIQRGVKITRLFALSDDEVRQNLDLLRQQERDGIEVIIIRPERVKWDYLLFDDQTLLYYDFDETGATRREHIVLDHLQVEKAVREFSDLATHAHAKTLKDFEAETGVGSRAHDSH